MSVHIAPLLRPSRLLHAVGFRLKTLRR